jgi:hypothetical protein
MAGVDFHPDSGGVTEPRTAAGVPADAMDRIRRARAARDEAERARVTAALAELRLEHVRDAAAILPPEIRQKLRDGTGPLPPEARRDQDARARLRAATRQLAADLGVDVAALDRLRSSTRARFAAILAPPAPARGQVRDLPEQADLAPQTFTSWGGWDAGYWSGSTSSNVQWDHNDSYYDLGSSRTGGHVRFRLRKTDSDDTVFLQRDNGFLVNYTMPATAPLRVEVDMTSAFGNHFVDTDDEWGTSDCWVETREDVLVDIYWDWNDWTPDSHSEGFITWSYTADTEHWIDGYPFPPGRRRTAILYPNAAFPAGHTVLVYVAMRPKAYAWLNDVSVTAGVNAAWYVTQIRVEAD